MNIQTFYCNTYPTDELGPEINENAHFAGLLNQLYLGGDVYEYLGVDDSIVRERCFAELAASLEADYDYIYNLWINKVA